MGDDYFGPPQTFEVTRLDGKQLGPEVPKHLVAPSEYSRPEPSTNFKICDFGESFLSNERPNRTRDAFGYRAPELLFEDQDWDYRIDNWSMGCTVYEAVIGTGPFNNWLNNRDELFEDITYAIGDRPTRWSSLRTQPKIFEEDERMSLEERLLYLYFDDENPKNRKRGDGNFTRRN